MQENQLISKCIEGDGIAFKQLLNNYRLRLFGYLWRFSDSRIEAEEMFQDTLIKVWKGFSKYDEQKKFSSWLFVIAHNVAMDNLRVKKNSKIFTSVEELENNSHIHNLENEIVLNETINLINESVKKLSEKQKTVFLLRQHGELTFREIADATNEPINTVISHMHYAVKKIKKQIEIENEPRRTSIQRI